MKALLIAIALLALLWVSNVTADGPVEDPVIPQQRQYPGAYIEIVKSEQRLRLRHGDIVYKEYPIAFGRGDPGSKERLGDS